MRPRTKTRSEGFITSLCRHHEVPEAINYLMREWIFGEEQRQGAAGREERWKLEGEESGGGEGRGEEVEGI
eukprot:660386-Hanusia_phi.AAC.1